MKWIEGSVSPLRSAFSRPVDRAHIDLLPTAQCRFYDLQAAHGTFPNFDWHGHLSESVDSVGQLRSICTKVLGVLATAASIDFGNTVRLGDLLTSNYTRDLRSGLRVTDRVVALVVIMVVLVASIGSIAAYVTNPLLNYASHADQSVPLRDEQISRAVKADRLVPKQAPSLRGGSEAIAPPAAAVVVRVVPLPPKRPKQAEAASTGLLNEAQLKGIKNRLRLTPQQAEQWPAVEDALREVARRHFQGRIPKHSESKRFETNSAEVQRLIAVSVPFIKNLREDQKRDLRELVRMIGLGTVASYI